MSSVHPAQSKGNFKYVQSRSHANSASPRVPSFDNNRSLFAALNQTSISLLKLSQQVLASTLVSVHLTNRTVAKPSSDFKVERESPGKIVIPPLLKREGSPLASGTHKVVSFTEIHHSPLNADQVVILENSETQRRVNPSLFCQLAEAIAENLKLTEALSEASKAFSLLPEAQSPQAQQQNAQLKSVSVSTVNANVQSDFDKEELLKIIKELEGRKISAAKKASLHSNVQQEMIETLKKQLAHVSAAHNGQSDLDLDVGEVEYHSISHIDCAAKDGIKAANIPPSTSAHLSHLHLLIAHLAQIRPFVIGAKRAYGLSWGFTTVVILLNFASLQATPNLLSSRSVPIYILLIRLTYPDEEVLFAEPNMPEANAELSSQACATCQRLGTDSHLSPQSFRSIAKLKPRPTQIETK
ncbi:hypothetical protein C8R46DRAFT_1034884 [Mycena filopes]|nr:hypothetical protein C8R46DRAFT_1034884 [Mycena filopes]